jgi:hypothetical protein
MNEIHIAGKTIPKPAIYASGAAAVGILAYAYWAKRGATPDATDPNAVDPNIDPYTGLPYSDEFGSGMGGSFTPSGNTYDPNTGTATLTNTNAAWAQAAQAYLTGVGYDPQVVGSAIGKALNGQYVTAEEIGIWSAAIAFEGYPPQGYPGLNTTPPGGQGGNGGNGGGDGDGGNGGGGTTPAVPKTTGKGPVSGLKALTKTTTSVTLDWNPVSGAKGYAIDRNGSRVVTVLYSQGKVSNLSPNTGYTFGVTPVMSNGDLGTVKTIRVTTAKPAAQPKLVKGVIKVKGK